MLGWPLDSKTYVTSRSSLRIILNLYLCCLAFILCVLCAVKNKIYLTYYDCNYYICDVGLPMTDKIFEPISLLLALF